MIHENIVKYGLYCTKMPAQITSKAENSSNKSTEQRLLLYNILGGNRSSFHFCAPLTAPAGRGAGRGGTLTSESVTTSPFRKCFPVVVMKTSNILPSSWGSLGTSTYKMEGGG